MRNNSNPQNSGPSPFPNKTSSEVAQMKRLLALFATPSGVITGAHSQEVSVGEAELLNRKAQWIGAVRWQRRAFLPPAMFGELAWDTLIQLYIAHDRQRLSVSALAEAIGAPQTTLLRWLDYLEVQGIVQSLPNPTDARVRFLSLTGKGLSTMTAYLQALPPLPT